MKIPFDIKFKPQIESGEYEVETRDGRPVRIVCYDRKYGFPIMALATEADGHESYVNCYFDGRFSRADEYSSDLFIIAPEPELSEFERAVGAEIFDPPFNAEQVKVIKEESAKLLVFARNEIVKSGYAIIEGEHYLEEGRKNYERGKAEALKEIEQDPESSYAFKRGVEYGKEEALKNLPRWKKAIGSCCVGKSIMFDEHGFYSADITKPGCRYITCDILAKLPGFNE